MKFHKAIVTLNPSVVVIHNDTAYDADGNEVIYDKVAVQALVDAEAYKTKRQAEYPDFRDYLDGIVKGDQAQVQKYIDDCLAVKTKYPKGNE